MRAPWLGDVLSDEGLTVLEHGNPLGRGVDMGAIHGVVAHDTTTTRSWDDSQVADLLEEGYQSLPGPLSQLGLDREGRFWWIADGRCHHNGFGHWGNDTIGIEVFCAGGRAGLEEPYNAIQRVNVARASAAILRHLGKYEGFCLGHKETDPDRKIDPFGVDMGVMRERVRQLLLGAGPLSEEAESSMGKIVKERGTNKLWYWGAPTFRIPNTDGVRQLVAANLVLNVDEVESGDYKAVSRFLLDAARRK